MARYASLLVTLMVLAGAMQAAPPDPKVPQGKNLDRPEGWVVRLDKPDPSVSIGAEETEGGIWFVNMTPGWHLTTGPAAIFYHPDSVANGASRIEALIYLFEPKGRHREAFGILFGGADLDGDNQTYDYFVIRNSGEFLIKRRTGSETSVIRNWTKSDAIVPYQEGKSSVKNVLTIEGGKDEVTFFINGTSVAKLPRAEVRLEGIVGLRVNHHVNIHVGDLSIRPLKTE